MECQQEQFFNYKTRHLFLLGLVFERRFCAFPSLLLSSTLLLVSVLEIRERICRIFDNNRIKSHYCDELSS